MDWRKRRYYTVTFDFRAHDMRMDFVKDFEGIRIHPYKDVAKQKDEACERGRYQYLMSVPDAEAEGLEYLFRKAQRNDGFCKWKEIIRADLCEVK